MTTADKAMFLAALIGALVIYCVPWIVALLYRHKHAEAIGALNVLLGWSLIGWVGALVWAFMDQPREETPKPTKPSPPAVKRRFPKPCTRH